HSLSWHTPLGTCREDIWLSRDSAPRKALSSACASRSSLFWRRENPAPAKSGEMEQRRGFLCLLFLILLCSFGSEVLAYPSEEELEEARRRILDAMNADPYHPSNWTPEEIEAMMIKPVVNIYAYFILYKTVQSYPSLA
ncbi:hypothetical protein lerEdw1_006130, partial [Lerista edwardsae]